MASDLEFPPEYYDDPRSVYEFLQRIGWSINEFAFNFTKYPVDYEFNKRMVTSASKWDVINTLLVAVLFTVVRAYATSKISIPLALKLGIHKKQWQKWSESLWKFVVYSILWSYSLYVVVLSGKYDYFRNPVTIFRGLVFDEHYLDRPLPTDLAIIYIAQLGFYLHSLFATFFMDPWRKDSVMMMLHHAVTIFLLEFSLLMKYHKIGTLILLVHDINDILLEFTKLNVYLKDRNNQFYVFHEWCANISFIVFTVTWACLRLYWFPLKILYTTNWGVYLYHKDKDPKMYLVLNTLLFTLQFLHIYWFYFVILLLFRIATGQQKEVDDAREFEEENDKKVDNVVGKGEHAD